MKLSLLFVFMFLLLAGCIGTRHPMDNRLIGQWKSNKELTIPTLHFRPGANPDAIKRLQNLFGHMILTYTPSSIISTTPATNAHAEQSDEGPYTIVARDATSVTIKCYNELEGHDDTWKITFEGLDRYWIDLKLIKGREYFDRIKN